MKENRCYYCTEREGTTTEEQEQFKKLREENRKLRQEREILKKATAWNADATNPTNPERVFEFVKSYQAGFPISKMCEVLGVSTSGY